MQLYFEMGKIVKGMLFSVNLRTIGAQVLLTLDVLLLFGLSFTPSDHFHPLSSSFNLPLANTTPFQIFSQVRPLGSYHIRVELIQWYMFNRS